MPARRWSRSSRRSQGKGCSIGRRIPKVPKWEGQCYMKGEREGTTDLCYGVLDDLLRGQVGLVAHKQLVDTLRCIPVNLLQPLLYVGESIYDE